MCGDNHWKKTQKRLMQIKVVIDETFTNSGIDVPFEFRIISVREGRIPLYEGVDYIVDHFRIYFTDEFLNECSMNNELIIEIK